MTPDVPTNPRADPEVKLTALILGELPADEAFSLGRAIEKDTELAKLYERLRLAAKLVRETAAAHAQPASAQLAELTLSEDRRQKLLQHFKTVRPKEFVKPPRRKFSVAGIAAIVALIAVGATIFLPTLSATKHSSSASFSRDLLAARSAMRRQKSGAASEQQPRGAYGGYALVNQNNDRALEEHQVPTARTSESVPSGTPPVASRSELKTIVLPATSQGGNTIESDTVPGENGRSIGWTDAQHQKQGDVGLADLKIGDRFGGAGGAGFAGGALSTGFLGRVGGVVPPGSEPPTMDRLPELGGRELQRSFNFSYARGDFPTIVPPASAVESGKVEFAAKDADAAFRRRYGLEASTGQPMSSDTLAQKTAETVAKSLAPAMAESSAGNKNDGKIQADKDVALTDAEHLKRVPAIIEKDLKAAKEPMQELSFGANGGPAIAGTGKTADILGDAVVAGRAFHSENEASFYRAITPGLAANSPPTALTDLTTALTTTPRIATAEALFEEAKAARDRASQEGLKNVETAWRTPPGLGIDKLSEGSRIGDPSSGETAPTVLRSPETPGRTEASLVQRKDELARKEPVWSSLKQPELAQSIPTAAQNNLLDSQFGQRTAAEQSLGYNKQQLGEESPAVVNLKQQIEDLDKRIGSSASRQNSQSNVYSLQVAGYLNAKVPLSNKVELNGLSAPGAAGQNVAAPRSTISGNTVVDTYANLSDEPHQKPSTSGNRASQDGLQVVEQNVNEPKAEVASLQGKLETAGVTTNGPLSASDLKKPAEDRPAQTPATPVAEPQPEILTRENAFSTFSLNVSDVSFKLAAASLEKGVMPEAGGIRSEEFINAFDYRDPEPAAGAPIAFAWDRALYPFAQSRELLRFSVKTAAQGRQAGRPLNIVLLLDRSGSMERADRVQISREALRVLASQLQAEDKLSVVAFARKARLVVDGAAGAQAAQVAEEVSKLTPEGGTNLEEAMALAYRTAHRHYLANGINRVVLLTDGAANLGNVEPATLKQRVEAERKQGIALDCFGIGWEGYNDDLLEVLSRNGDGRYGFINTPEEAASQFATQLAGALRVAAADVKVQVEFNPNRVTAYRQIGYAKHQLTKEQFRDNTVDAAEIGAAESGNALYVTDVNPRGEGPLAIVRVRYKIPGTSEFHEQEWTVPYNGNSLSLDQAAPAMRLAGTASAFAEWLASSPYAAEVRLDRLLGCLAGVPEVYGADARPKKLEWMIRQAKSVTGK